MKVAYILPSLQNPSGWRTLTLGLLNHIDAAQLDAFIFAPPEYQAQAKAIFPGKTICTLPTTQQFSLATIQGMLKLLACRRTISRGSFPEFDLVHSLEAYPTGLVGSWLARKVKRPHVFTAHGTYSVIWAKPSGLAGQLDRRAYQWVLGQTRLICAVSAGTAQQIRRIGFRQQSQESRERNSTEVKVISPGNDFYQRVPRQMAMDRAAPDTPTLLTVGDLKPRKGQHLSLAAFAQVKQQLPDARYWLVGSYHPDQPYFQQLRQHSDGVTFMGVVSDDQLNRCYQDASLFVLTPQHDDLNFEGFGLVYLEAGAYGLPVVAARTGGVPDAVKDGETGILVEPGDVSAIAAAILRLLTDSELARKMGRANRDWAESLTWERFAQAHLKAYAEIIGNDDSSGNGLAREIRW